MTSRMRPVFTVKQYQPSLQPWIAIEPLTSDNDFPSQLFAFDLPEGTSFERALKIAEFLNENVTHFACSP